MLALGTQNSAGRGLGGTVGALGVDESVAALDSHQDEGDAGPEVRGCGGGEGPGKGRKNRGHRILYN